MVAFPHACSMRMVLALWTILDFILLRAAFFWVWGGGVVTSYCYFVLRLSNKIILAVSECLLNTKKPLGSDVHLWRRIALWYWVCVGLGDCWSKFTSYESFYLWDLTVSCFKSYGRFCCDLLQLSICVRSVMICWVLAPSNLASEPKDGVKLTSAWLVDTWPCVCCFHESWCKFWWHGWKRVCYIFVHV